MNPARTSVRVALSVLLVAVTATAARAQDAPQQQREHIVRPGDTLWDLARTYFNDPFQWRLIAEANSLVVEDPHWIFPRERLIIPPFLRTPAEPVGVPFDPTPAVTPEPVQMEAVDSPTVAATLDLRRPIVPMREYLAAPWLSAAPDRSITGRITRMTDPASVDDRIASGLHPRDRVVVEGSFGSAGDSLLIVRVGRRIGSNGLVVQPMGVLAIEESGPSGIVAQVVQQFSDARVGDAVMPMPSAPQIGLGQPEPVDLGVEGHLLQFLIDQPLYATSDIAFVSIGRNSGLGIGDELAVYVPADGAPVAGERVATLRVLRADETTATVRVLTASSTALRNGLPVRLIRRMPVN